MPRNAPAPLAFLWLPVLWIFTAHAASTPAALSLVSDGHSDYVIICQSNWFDRFPAMRGAQQIQTYIQEITGAHLPILDCSADLPDKAIIVGVNRYTDQLGIHLDPSMGDDAFIMKTIGNRIVLAGPGKRGSMYAAFAFLEKLGVRWYTPSVTQIPHQANLQIAPLDETQTPSFEYREPLFSEAFDPDWCSHLRCNSDWAPLDAGYGGKIKYSPYFVHTLWRIIPEEQYGKTHPEYFPLIKGKRVVEQRAVQRCLSNPDVLKIAIDTVDHWMDLDPDGMIFSVSQNDTSNYCTCDNCQKLMQQYGGPSGEYLWFVNQIAEAMEKKHPGKLIDTLAYQFTEKPPTGIKPRDNVRIRLCPISCCEAHPYEQCSYPANKAFLNNLKGWAAITDNLYIWHYSTDFSHYLMPFPDFHQFPDSIRLYKRTGVKGVFFESDNDPGGGASDAELRAYVMAHLLWNCDADANQLIDDWMQGVYGPEAAKPMRKWFDLVQNQVKDPKLHVRIYDPPSARLFPPDLIAAGDQLLAQATTIDASNPLALQYIHKAQLDLRYVKLVLHPVQGQELLHFIDDVHSFGIQDISERRPIESWEKTYLKQFASTTQKSSN